jgi:hypothetical protein
MEKGELSLDTQKKVRSTNTNFMKKKRGVSLRTDFENVRGNLLYNHSVLLYLTFLKGCLLKTRGFFKNLIIKACVKSWPPF